MFCFVFLNRISSTCNCRD